MATIHNPLFGSLSKNDCVAVAINHIKDEVFWKAIFCLHSAVFHALTALRYCDSNIHTMDKKFFLMTKTCEILLDSQKLLDDEDLFGPMSGVALSDCKQELNKVFGETNTERNGY